MVFVIDLPAFFKSEPPGRIPVPPLAEFVAALEKGKAVLGTVNVDGDEAALDLLASFGNAGAAEEMAAKTNALIAFAKTSLAQLPPEARKQGPPGVDPAKLFAAAEKALESARAKSDGKQASLGVRLPVSGLAVFTTMFGIRKQSAGRGQQENNLKQLGLGLHNYHETHRKFPAANWKGPDGKAKHAHSWRVAILPFIDQKTLYDEYQLDEPWDSDANQAVMAKMPEVFRSPDDAEAKERHWTNVFALVGDGAAWEQDEGVAIKDFTDGLSNTVLLVEAQRKIPWNKPDDIGYEKQGDLPKLGGLSPGGRNVLMGDGSVRFVSDQLDEKVWRAMITRAGGEVVNP